MAELEQIERQREQVPIEPELHEADVILIRAWGKLNTCRAIGMSVGAIPWTAITAWCDRQGLDRAAATVVEDVVAFLDGKRAEEAAAARDLEKARPSGKKGK